VDPDACERSVSQGTARKLRNAQEANGHRRFRLLPLFAVLLQEAQVRAVKIETLTNRLDAHRYACSFLRPAKSVLDIGCGIHPQEILLPECEHHLIEPHLPYLEEGMQRRRRPGQAICGDWAYGISKFEEKSVDTIFLVDVIEHLEKDEAAELLRKTVPIARRQVLIFTPYGFMEQPMVEGEDLWGMDTGGNAYQVHRSGWYPQDFEEYSGKYNETRVFICPDYHQFRDRRPPLPNGVFAAMWVIIDNEQYR
jgi:hypothetical protein